MKVTKRWRYWAGAVAGFAITSGLGPLMDPKPYNVPIFNAVRAIAPWSVWAACWLAVAVLAAWTMVTRRAWAWRASVLGSIAIGGTWLFGVSWEHWVNDRPVSPTGLALWAWYLATNMIAATSRHQFEGA